MNRPRTIWPDVLSILLLLLGLTSPSRAQAGGPTSPGGTYRRPRSTERTPLVTGTAVGLMAGVVDW